MWTRERIRTESKHNWKTQNHPTSLFEAAVVALLHFVINDFNEMRATTRTQVQTSL